MSVRQGKNIISGRSTIGVNLFDFKWADHLLNDISWLRADTFSWQSGDVYIAAYNHLYNDYMEVSISSDNLYRDRVDDIIVFYWLAKDGHKIAVAGQEAAVQVMYEKTGVAWYYILDTANKQFKLPRSKHNKYADTVSVVGNGTPFTLTTNEVNGANMSQYNNIYQVSQISGVDSIPVNTLLKISSDPTKSGMISTPVEDTDQYKYLYFYVGNFERDAVEQTAGIAEEMFNSKADSDLKNIPANYDYVVESQIPTEANDYTWYRKYKSGWVEQGGFAENSSGDYNVVLPIEMNDTMYSITAMNSIQSGKDAFGWIFNINKTTTGFTLGARHSGGTSNYLNANWQVSGMSAQ